MPETKKLRLEGPTEAQSVPCLDMNTQQGRLRGPINQLTLTKTGRVVILSFIVVSVVLFIVVIAMAAAWPRWPPHLGNTCNKPACLIASAQILEYANLSNSACTDTWSWACGGWLHKHRDKSAWGYHEEIEYQETLRARALIGSLPPGPPGSPEWLLTELYASCTATESLEAEGDLPLKKIIRDLDGWHVLRSWSLLSWDFRKALSRVQGRYGAAPFISVSVEPDPTRSVSGQITNASVIVVRPPKLGLPHPSLYYQASDHAITVAYKRLLRDVVTLLGATANDASGFSDDLFYYERRLAEVEQSTVQQFSSFSTKYVMVTIKELQADAPSLPVYDILSTMYPRAKLRLTSRIAVPSLMYMQRLSELITSSDRGSVNNYIMWTLAHTYLKYMSAPYRSALQEFKQVLTGSIQPLERWQYCTDVVRKWGGVALAALQQNSTELNRAESQTVDIFNVIKEQVINAVLQNKFIEGDKQRKAVKMLKTIQLQIGLPGNALSPSFLKQYYHEFAVLRGAFFENSLSSHDFKRYNTEQNLLVDYEASRQMNTLVEALTEVPLRARYVKDLQVVTLPVGLLAEPNFNPDYPMPIQLARIGLTLAQSLIQSVIDFVTEKDELDENIHTCFDELLKRHNMSAFGYSDALVHVSASRVVFQALKPLLNNNYVHIYQHGLEHLDDRGLLAIAYAQTHCSSSTPQWEAVSPLIERRLSERHLLQLSWSQVPSYRKSLHCSAPSEKLCEEEL